MMKQSRMRILMISQIVWVATVCLLGFWWGHLVLKQAGQIAELERQVGLSHNLIELQFLKTQRMLYWESGTFFVFLLGSMALFLGLYWRDVKRARAAQAFFASVTHELRTPLASIRLQAESISDGVHGTELERERNHALLARRLIEDCMRLESQVERTLELARVEGGGGVFSQPMNLKMAADRLLKSWAPAFQDRLEVHNQLEAVDVLADVSALQVILKNLIDNSLRHASSGGERVQVTLKSYRKDGTVEVHLTDGGTSFQGSPEKLGQIFNKGPKSQGAGVGLYLVKLLMEKMGGKVSFSSKTGGLTVILSFREAADIGEVL